MYWRKSTYSSTNGDCVETATDGGLIYVRDSKDPEGPVLSFTASEWSAWLAGCKAGEFDDLVN